MVTLMQHRALCSIATLMLENSALAFHNALGQTTASHDRATQNTYARGSFTYLLINLTDLKEMTGNISVCSFIQLFHSKTKITKKDPSFSIAPPPPQQRF